MQYSTALIDRIRPRVPMVVAIGCLALGCIGAQASDLQEVTVTVPTVQTIGHDASGAPIQQVTASARVQYDPAMLTTHSGRALLRDKVAQVARRLCREINTVATNPAED